MSEEKPTPEPEPRQPRLPHQVGHRQRSLAGDPAVVVVPQPPGMVRRMVTWLGWVGFGFCLVIIFGMVAAYQDYFDTTGGIQEKYHSLSKTARAKVAVIDVSGVIMEGDGFVKRQIDRIRDDDHVKAVVLRIDSPGGTITGSDYIYHHLVKLREERGLPMVVSMGGIATSGGYYVAMAVGDQEQSIFAEPTTTTGSIGVIIPHYDLTGLLERLDIKNNSIASHPRKQLLSMTKPMSEEDRAILEKYIGHAFDRFKQVVMAGRPQFEENKQALDEIATGEIFTSEQARELGLVDEVGFVEAAVNRAVELSGLTKDNVRVVTFKKPLTLVNVLGSAQSASASFTLPQLLELSSPRAYYLTTSLPAFVSTQRVLGGAQ